MAGEARINDQRDWYAILQVLRYTQNIDYIAAQYRRLATQLDPSHNPFAFAAHAFTLVNHAWTLLSNPTKKALYDNHLRLLTQPQPQPPPPAPVPFFPIPELHQPPPPSQDDNATEAQRPTFWTACPYCYVMYEYPNLYEDCTLRCQSCRRGFHALLVRSPPQDVTFASFCSWGFFPLGFSGDYKDINGSSSNWNPFSPLFPCALKGADDNSRCPKGPSVFYDDDVSAEFMEGGSDTTQDDSDDDDWRGGNQKGTANRRKRSNVGDADGDVKSLPPIERPRRRGVHNDNVGNAQAVNGDGGGAIAAMPESSKKAAALGVSRRRSGRNLGKLDLNVEFSNEVEEPVHGAGEGNGNGNGNDEDNIEGIGFFEGLDEFLNSLPILNVVADDKVKGH